MKKLFQEYLDWIDLQRRDLTNFDEYPHVDIRLDADDPVEQAKYIGKYCTMMVNSGVSDESIPHHLGLVQGMLYANGYFSLAELSRHRDRGSLYQ